MRSICSVLGGGYTTDRMIAARALLSVALIAIDAMLFRFVTAGDAEGPASHETVVVANLLVFTTLFVLFGIFFHVGDGSSPLTLEDVAALPESLHGRARQWLDADPERPLTWSDVREWGNVEAQARIQHAARVRRAHLLANQRAGLRRTRSADGALP